MSDAPLKEMDDFVIVDLETGTIIGNNCVAVRKGYFAVEDLSDSEIIELAELRGLELIINGV